MKKEEIISDAEINLVHGNANFGKNISKREVVDQAVIKYSCDYPSGSTARAIVKAHGLLRKDDRLTRKGIMYLRCIFHEINIFK